MKRFEPANLSLVGIVVAPLASALNSLLLHLVFGGFYRRLFADFLQVWIGILIFTLPLGWMSMKLMEIWRKGKFVLVRCLGGACGAFTIAFWFWLWRDDSSHWREPEYGALAIPFLWSLLIPIFAVCARAPKG